MNSELIDLFWYSFFELLIIIFSSFLIPIVIYYVSFYWDDKYKLNYTRNEVKEIVILFIVFFIIFIWIQRININKKEKSLNCYYWILENYSYSESNWIFYDTKWKPYDDNSFMQYILESRLKEINKNCNPYDDQEYDTYNWKFY